MDWNYTAGADPAFIKANLPITYVLEKAGYPGTPTDGKVVTRCPFHLDSNPSFDVYGENLERWGCYPCSLGGDVLDLISRLHKTSNFSETMDLAEKLIKDKADEGWDGATAGPPKQPFDWGAARALVEGARSATPSVLPVVQFFLDTRTAAAPGLAVTPEWLVREFRLGVEGGDLIIPYYNRDGDLVSYKHRDKNGQSKALSPRGSGQFDDVLYGEWRDEGGPVLLCEGESDVWAAAAAGLNALGLPTGAGAHPRQAPRLAGRPVTLAFDGDKAGRESTAKWWAALRAAGCGVLIAPVPDGADLASLTHSAIREVVSRARPVTDAPPGIGVGDTGYYRPGKETNTPLTNWVFTPYRELRGEGSNAYEGTVFGKDTVLSSHDLGAKSRVVSWAARHGGAWYGADRDAQLLLGLLQAQGPFLATGRMATVAGLHEGQFIWPGGRIGSDYWVYVAPSTDVHLAERISLSEADWSPSQIPVLRTLHTQNVMDPMLAWMAVAPLRSMLREFPILAVTGSSGTGKTTLLETVLRNFTGSLVTNNLTATTRHSVFAFVGSTNAFPVWFDEYRPGARKDAIESLNQLLRDAYTAQASSKGGMGEHWAEVVSVPTSAPLIVSGEDAFSETSHTERMALLALPREGRNPEALERIKAWGPHGLPHAYLTWLYLGLQEGFLPVIRNFDAGPEDLPPRQKLSLGVLTLGWALLHQFVRTFDGSIDLGEPDFSLVIEEGRESSKSNPIQDALRWCLDEFDAAEFVASDKDFVFVRVENFIHYSTSRGGFILPGGPKAVASFLRNHYGATEGVGYFAGSPKRAWVFPRGTLDR